MFIPVRALLNDCFIFGEWVRVPLRVTGGHWLYPKRVHIVHCTIRLQRASKSLPLLGRYGAITLLSTGLMSRKISTRLGFVFPRV